MPSCTEYLEMAERLEIGEGERHRFYLDQLLRVVLRLVCVCGQTGRLNAGRTGAARSAVPNGQQQFGWGTGQT